MKSTILTSATLGVLAAFISSCTPYPEPPPVPTPPAVPGDEVKDETEGDDVTVESTDLPTPEDMRDPVPPPTPNNTTNKPSTSVARPVPGKPGFVFSPYNNKIIDVKGIPSGTLVADPTYPASDKKYFRVP